MAVEIALPYRTDWREMSNVLDYCKGKGADRSSLEARFGSGESLRETLNALEQLGLIDRSDTGDARLTGSGEALAYAPDQARLRERLTEAMLGYPPYRFPLERALADQLTVLDGPWVEHIWQVDMRLGQPRNRVAEARTFFYRLAGEAGLGTYRRGVRGQSTRLELARDFAEQLNPVFERLSSAAQAPAVAPRATSSARGQDGPDRAAASEPSAVAAMDAGADMAQSPMAPPQVAAFGSLAQNLAPQDPSALQAAAVGLLPGLPAGISIQVDMSNWDLEQIEGFLRLIGYLPPR